jgi:DNA-binding beta-propeller fold protein YncE
MSDASTFNGARSAVTALAIVLACGVASLLCSTPASALLEQGHVFAGTFEGAGVRSFGLPSGLAVDEATGDVYVVDRAHERVERFRPDVGGYEFQGEFVVPNPGAIAIDDSSSESDPSRSDVYVAGAGTPEEKEDGERNYLYKFTASGEKIFKRRVFKAKENKEEFETELERISGLAVDAGGRVWVYWSESGDITGLGDEEQNRLIPSLTKEEVLTQPALEVGCAAEPGLAVGPGDEAMYVAHERENGLGECPEGEPAPTMVSQLAASGAATERSLDNQDATGVAVDPGDGVVYVDDVTSVAAFSEDGSFIQRFGSGQVSGGGAVAVDSGRGIVYLAEPGKVAVFSREGAGAPSIDGVSAQNLTPTSERVDAQIDPDGTQTSYYVEYGASDCMEHEIACQYAPVGPPGEAIGAGFGDVSVHAALEGLQPDATYYFWVVAANGHGTVESTHSAQTFFTTLPSAEGVLLDHRQWQLVSPTDMRGASPEAIDPPFLGSLIQASSEGDALAWTASAPISGQAQGNRQPEPEQVISRRGSEEWSSEEISTSHDEGEGVSTEEPTEYRFFSPDLSLAIVEPQILKEPLEDPPLAAGVTEKTIYTRSDGGVFEPLVSSDATGAAFGGELEFEGAAVEPAGAASGEERLHVVFGSQVPLLAGSGESGLYEWQEGAPLKLVSVLPGDEHTPASSPRLGFEHADVRGAISQDGSKVFWTNQEELGPLYVRNTSREETVQVNAAQQGLREAGAAEREAGLDEVYFQAASSDGSKVFFTDTWPLTSESTLEPYEEEEAPRRADLYEYNTETGDLTDLTVNQSAGERAEVLGTLPGVSEDGSYVYFVANGVLSPGAERGDCPRSDPYRNPGASRQGECNLYVSEPDPADPTRRQTRLIARLSEEDAADWGEGDSPVPGDLGGVTAQASADGRYLAFMSDRELTGYDNVDTASQAKGAHDEEVFLYDATTGSLVCASCNPSGHAPNGVFDTNTGGEGVGLAVDRPEIWNERWLAASLPGWTLYGYDPPMTEHQSRYLSNNGRLFFNSADALVAEDREPTREETVDGQAVQVGVENVYEYEPEGRGSCMQAGGCVALISSGTSQHESAFMDAGEGGDDVFFETQAKLVAQDTEPSAEVYDAAVCGTGESRPCLPAKEPPAKGCTGEECRGPAGQQVSFEVPPTSTSSPSSGPAQPPVTPAGAAAAPKPRRLTRAQKLANALKACRKNKRKKQRQACERKVRKAYGANTTPKKASVKRANTSNRRGR